MVIQMTTERLSRLRRLCNAVPETEFDRRFKSLSVLQRVLVLVVTSIIIVAVDSLLVPPEMVALVAVPLAFGTMWAIVDLLTWYNDDGTHLSDEGNRD